MEVPDPTSTQPYPVERRSTPTPEPAPRAAVAREVRSWTRFSPLSFALGMLTGITIASCLSGVALLLVVWSA